MKKLYYESIEDFAEFVNEVYDVLDKDEFEDLSVVAKYEEARRLLEELAYCFDIVSVDLHSPECNGYSNEYILSINTDGIWIEPFKRDGEYILNISTVAFILNNCSSGCIPHCKASIVYEVGIADEEECDGCCEDCHYAEFENVETSVSTEENEPDCDLYGFTATCNSEDGNGYRYVSFHTTERLDKEELIEIAKKFGIGFGI